MPLHLRYLQLFTRDEGGGDPVNIIGQNMTKRAHNGPVDFPSTIWKNGDHYNFIAQGARFTTKDKTLREWTRVVEKDPAQPDMIGCHENGGQWWIPTPNQVGGAPPPAGTPNQLVNCGGGSTYRIGNYFPANESFVWKSGPSSRKTASLSMSCQLLTPLMNPGPLYSRGKGTLRAACSARTGGKGAENMPKPMIRRADRAARGEWWG